MWHHMFLVSYEMSPVAAAEEVLYLEESGLHTHSADIVTSVELRHLRRRASEKEREELAAALDTAVRAGQLRRNYDGAYTRVRPGDVPGGPCLQSLRAARRAPTGLPGDYYGDDHFQGVGGRNPRFSEDDGWRGGPTQGPSPDGHAQPLHLPALRLGPLGPPLPGGPPAPPGPPAPESPQMPGRAPTPQRPISPPLPPLPSPVTPRSNDDPPDPYRTPEPPKRPGPFGQTDPLGFPDPNGGNPPPPGPL